MTFLQGTQAYPGLVHPREALMPFVEIQMFICKESSGPTLAVMSLAGELCILLSVVEAELLIEWAAIKGIGRRLGANPFAC